MFEGMNTSGAGLVVSQSEAYYTLLLGADDQDQYVVAQRGARLAYSRRLQHLLINHQWPVLVRHSDHHMALIDMQICRSVLHPHRFAFSLAATLPHCSDYLSRRRCHRLVLSSGQPDQGVVASAFDPRSSLWNSVLMYRLTGKNTLLRRGWPLIRLVWSTPMCVGSCKIVCHKLMFADENGSSERGFTRYPDLAILFHLDVVSPSTFLYIGEE